MRSKTLVLSIVLVLAALGCRRDGASSGAELRRPLIEGLSSHHMPTSTKSPDAQKYFDQGVRLMYGFNHDEAIRAFEQAAKLDPACAMCFWGIALSLGPNINKPMLPEENPRALEAVAKAQAQVGGASEREQAYVAAVATRYEAAPDAQRPALDRAYADAMKALAARFPDDDDAQVLYAEALMDLTPWDYWTKEGEPKAATEEIVSLLEKAMATNPDHPGANHFYIHAVEASKTPGRALAAAKKLETLATSSGHLVHMSAHTYMRVGNYAGASVANERGARVDEEYMAWCKQGGYYPNTYYPHNIHFLYASTAFEGRSSASIAAARKLAEKVTPEIVKTVPLAEEFPPMPYYALARFGRWDELLAEPAPIEAQRYSTGVWHYARGIALAAKGRIDDAKAEHAAVLAIAAEPGVISSAFSSGASPATILGLAAHSLASDIAFRTGRYDEALAELGSAREIEVALPYTEPPLWYFPTRQAEGAILLAAGRAADAEAAFSADLVDYPENGWALYGLAESQKLQGKPDADARARFTTAWTAADTQLSSPRF